MAKDEAYQKAERKIEKARQSGATELNLNSIGLTELPETIGQLTALQELSLNNNQLTALPETIGQLTVLKMLDVSGNQLTALPETIGQLTALKTLHLDDNQLTALPETIGQLTALQELSLNDNQLTALPETIGQLTALQELSLNDNQLPELPETIGQLTALQHLSLNYNQLTALPETIGELTVLKRLRLRRNQLTALPETIGQLTTLALYINDNQLTVLPETIGQLTALKTLHLDDNQLTALPETIGQLTALKTLYLGYNQLTALPETIGQLTALKTLYLGYNQLTALPETIGQLTSLDMLHLDRNQLMFLPKTIGQLTALKRLYLDDNPLNPELAAAYYQGLNAVKAYLRAKDEAQIVLNEAKLILIGEGGVGKTSLLAALRGEAFVEKRKSTHGVEVDIQSLTVSAADSGVEITLNGWDFGGQNIYRHTHQLFFTAPAVYLAVWEPRRGPEQCRVEEWIKMVKHRAYDESRPEERPRILIVATHGGPQERLDHIDEQALRDEFGDLIAGFHHVDCKPDKNGVCYQLEELKAAIGCEAAAIPSVGREVPLSWKNVLGAVRQRSKKEPCIDYKQFEKLCEDQGVSKELITTYALILNELGHMIYYHNDEALRNTVILNPEYLSKAVGFVLEDKKTKDAYGLIEHKRLPEIWQNPNKSANERYPKKLHGIFLSLMNKFDLSYQVVMPKAGASQASLLAQLVPGMRPEGWQEDWQLNPGDTERTQVCRVLDAVTGRTTEAEGLIYRLIVRLHRYSLGRADYQMSRHWKTGMLLDDGYNGRGFIEEIGGDLHVTVRAAYPERFLHHLCSEIEWLVEHFWKGLDARLFVPCQTENCKGLVEFRAMLQNKANEMPKIRCAVCEKYHVIDTLMATMQPKPEYGDAIKELSKGQTKILGAVEKGFDSVDVQLRTLMSQVDEQYEALLTTFTDQAKEGPRLFSFEPVERSKFNPKSWTRHKFKLSLWCEHRCVPLTALNEPEDTNGVYEIELSKEWVQKAAPVLKAISTTLSLALSIAVPGTKLVAGEEAYKAIAGQLEFGVATSKAFLKGGQEMSDWLVVDDKSALDQNREAIRAQGSVLRELHSMLKKVDPNNGFGGLVRVQNKRRQFLWVHEQFKTEY